MSTTNLSIGFDKETATVSRIYDYLILVLAGFLYIGSYHLHFMLTVGDWDFWLDWKAQALHRQFYILSCVV